MPTVEKSFCLKRPPAAVFAPILFVYVLLFEEKWDVWTSAKRALPAFVACVGSGAFVMAREAGNFTPAAARRHHLNRLEGMASQVEPDGRAAPKQAHTPEPPSRWHEPLFALSIPGPALECERAFAGVSGPRHVPRSRLWLRGVRATDDGAACMP